MSRISKLCHFSAYFFVTLAVFGLYSATSRAQAATQSWDSFLAPNEISPIELKPIIEAAEPGVYVTVGTERGFITIGLDETQRFTRLLLLDTDPNVVRYNEINIALLKAATSRQNYLQLRLQATEADWSPHNDSTLNQNNRLWWREHVVNNEKFETFHRAVNGKSEKLNFVDANYLFLDANFARVKRLADLNQIEAHEVDVGSETFDEILLLEFFDHGQKLSVFDLSNAWVKSYLGHQGTKKVLKSLLPNIDSRSLLVLTETRMALMKPFDFAYLGFRLEDIKKMGVDLFTLQLNIQDDQVSRHSFRTTAQGITINRADMRLSLKEAVCGFYLKIKSRLKFNSRAVSQ